MGDSHAGMFLDGIRDSAEKLDYNLTFFGMAACYPLFNATAMTKKNRVRCKEFMSYIADYVVKNKTDTVIIAARWANVASNLPAPGDGKLSLKLINNKGQITNLKESLEQTVKLLQDNKIKVVVIGPVPEIAFHVPETLIRAKTGISRLPKVSVKDFYLRQNMVLRIFDGIEKNLNARVVYPHKIMCDGDSCMISSNNMALYKDNDHLTHTGVQILMKEIRDTLRN